MEGSGNGETGEDRGNDSEGVGATIESNGDSRGSGGKSAVLGDFPWNVRRRSDLGSSESRGNDASEECVEFDSRGGVECVAGDGCRGYGGVFATREVGDDSRGNPVR